MVVRGVSNDSAKPESSKPTTATSSGTERPARRRVAIAPAAMRSDAAKTASMAGSRASRISMAREPDSEE